MLRRACQPSPAWPRPHFVSRRLCLITRKPGSGANSQTPSLRQKRDNTQLERAPHGAYRSPRSARHCCCQSGASDKSRGNASRLWQTQPDSARQKRCPDLWQADPVRHRRTKLACMVRRRSMVRFRSRAQVDDLIRKDSNGSWMSVGTNGCPQGTGSPASAIPARPCRQLRGNAPGRPSDPAPLVTQGNRAPERSATIESRPAHVASPGA